MSNIAIQKRYFEEAYQHLDLIEAKDAWGRPIYKHSHVQAMWDGFQKGWSARLKEAARSILEDAQFD